MTDRELIDYLSGQLTAVTFFCGAMAKTQLDSKVLSREFLAHYEQFCALAESWKVSESWTAGLQQTRKELATHIDDG